MHYLFIAFMCGTGMYHGALFMDSPMPGNPDMAGGARLKSRGIDRRGSKTIEECEALCWECIEQSRGSLPVTFCQTLLSLEGDEHTPQVLLAPAEWLEARTPLAEIEGEGG